MPRTITLCNDGFSFHFSDDDIDYKELFDYAKHLSKEDKKVLFGVEEIKTDEDSNLSFEREMENEVRSHINGIHMDTQSFPLNSDILPVASTSKTKEQKNDLLFYDCDQDLHDQEWLDSYRAQSVNNSTKESKQQQLHECTRLKEIQSDATLNCPCCLTLLCLDCQRHEIYRTQYRAMFVLNCRIERSAKLIYRNKEELRKKFKRSRKYRAKQDSETITDIKDIYNPVFCVKCNTQVALFDCDEVYHFFSVLASH